MSDCASSMMIDGNFSVGEVDLTYNPVSNRLIDPEVEQLIDEAWATQLKLAEQKGMKLYDSEAYRLNAIKSATGRLFLELAPTSYKIHAAMKAIHSDPLVSEEHFDKTLIANALVMTTDHKYLLGRVRKVIEETVYLIGGTCAKARVNITSAADIFEYAQKRVSEVLRVDESSVTAGALIGLIQNEVGCVNATFKTEVDLTADAIQAAFRPSNGITELITVDEDAIKLYLSEGEGYIAAIADLV